MIIFYVCVGVIIDEIDWLCYDYVVNELKVIFVNIGYYGYVYIVCILVNYVVCYGILLDKKFKNGDIVNIDVVIIKDGWYGDISRMYYVGELLVRVKCLVDIIYLLMVVGIKVVCSGVIFGDIGVVI